MEFTEESKTIFWSKVDIKTSEDCWLWKGYRDTSRSKRGIYWHKNQRYAVNRFSYIISKGAIGPKEVVAHICGERYCCNPNHLIVGTKFDLYPKFPNINRFLSHIEPQKNGCIYWTGPKNNMGYGCFSLSNDKGKWVKMLAHRWYYQYCKGPIPEQLVMDHLCRAPLCVNPEHLEPVTNRENTIRGLIGQKNGCINNHPYDLWNTYFNKKGHRKCRKCANEKEKARHKNLVLQKAMRAADEALKD